MTENLETIIKSTTKLYYFDVKFNITKIERGVYNHCIRYYLVHSNFVFGFFFIRFISEFVFEY